MNEMFEDPDSILFRKNPALFARRETALDDLRQCQRQIVQTLPNYKQLLCPRLEKYGFCRYSDFCYYAHGENEKKIFLCNFAHGEPERLHLYYKTDFCFFHLSCPSGDTDNCRYAHTPDEIRNISDNIRLWKSSFQMSKMDVKQNENDWSVLNSSNSDSSYPLSSLSSISSAPKSEITTTNTSNTNSKLVYSSSTGLPSRKFSFPPPKISKFSFPSPSFPPPNISNIIQNGSNLNPNAVPFSSSSHSLSSDSNSSTMSCSTKTVLNNSDLNPNATPFFSPNGKVFNRNKQTPQVPWVCIKWHNLMQNLH